MSGDKMPVAFDDFFETILKIPDLSILRDKEPFLMDIDMVKILLAVDRRKPVKSIAEETGLTVEQLWNSVAKLIMTGLIEPLEKKSQFLDQAFFDSLAKIMTRIIGPIAPVLVDDAIASLGYEPSRFPLDQVTELIDILASGIQQKEKRLAFQEKVMKMLRRTVA